MSTASTDRFERRLQAFRSNSQGWEIQLQTIRKHVETA